MKNNQSWFSSFGLEDLGISHLRLQPAEVLGPSLITPFLLVHKGTEADYDDNNDDDDVDDVDDVDPLDHPIPLLAEEET